MRLKPLSSIDRDRLFYLDKIIASEHDLEMQASTRNNELSIRIFIDGLIHLQITNESYKVKFMDYVFENKERKSPLHSFFEITDDSYMDWLAEESFGFFEKKYYKAYVFFFDDSVVEVVSADDSIIKAEVVSSGESVCSRVVIGMSGGNPILEKAQNNAVQTKTLPDGRIRYYETECLAEAEGQTQRKNFVTEYNPTTGQIRQWTENYDHSGNATSIEPICNRVQ